MNPTQFNSKIYGYSTTETMKKPTMSDSEMKNIVDSVLHQMNTQPHEVSYYNTTSTYSPSIPPTYIINKNQIPPKKNTMVDFSPEFYNVLKSMISKEVEKQMNEKNKINKPKETMNQNLLKRLNYYEKKINLLEKQIILLKNNF